MRKLQLLLTLITFLFLLEEASDCYKGIKEADKKEKVEESKKIEKEGETVDFDKLPNLVGYTGTLFTFVTKQTYRNTCLKIRLAKRLTSISLYKLYYSYIYYE